MDEYSLVNLTLHGVLAQTTGTGGGAGGAANDAPMVGPTGMGPAAGPAPAPTPAPPANAPVTGTGVGTGTATTMASGVPTTQPEKPGWFQQLGTFLPIVLMIGLMYVLLFRGQRKEEKKRKLMVSEMKKGDRVMTIGGLVAKVVSVDGEEVVLKIDEAANVKATYKKSAIQQVLVGDEKAK